MFSLSSELKVVIYLFVLEVSRHQFTYIHAVGVFIIGASVQEVQITLGQVLKSFKLYFV